MERAAALSVRLLGRAFYADLPAHLKLTLLALCDEASEDGSGICVGQARLARKVGATDRTVRSNLTALDAAGWIHKLPEKSAKYHTDQWEIDIDRLPHGPETSSGRRPETSSGGQPRRPEAGRQEDRKSDVETTGSGLPPTQELTQEPTRKDILVADHFAEFWQMYPRKVGRPKALIAFCSAVKRGVEPLAIIHGAERFRADPNRLDEFTPHPTTWIHREGWNDPSLPARNGNGSAAGRTHALAQSMRERGM